MDELLETALAPKTDAVKRRGAAMGVGATVKGRDLAFGASCWCLMVSHDVFYVFASKAIKIASFH